MLHAQYYVVAGVCELCLQSRSLWACPRMSGDDLVSRTVLLTMRGGYLRYGRLFSAVRRVVSVQQPLVILAFMTVPPVGLPVTMQT